MIEIKSADKVLARIIKSNDISEGLSFYSDDSDYIQTGFWNYNSGKVLAKHYHLEATRQVKQTHEVIHVLSGRIKVEVYQKTGDLVETVEITTGDTMILLDCGHGYEILEDGTRVLEVKSGPYPGAEADRIRF